MEAFRPLSSSEYRSLSKTDWAKLTSTLIQEEITKKRLMEQLKNNEMSFEL